MLELCHGEKWSDLFQSLLAHNSLMADLGSRFLAYSKAENCLKKRRYLQPPTQISSSAHADIFKSSWRYLPHRLHVNKPLIALIWRIEGLEKFVVPPVFASIDARFFRTAIIGNQTAIIRQLLISQVLIKLRSVCSQNSPLADIIRAISAICGEQKALTPYNAVVCYEGRRQVVRMVYPIKDFSLIPSRK